MLPGNMSGSISYVFTYRYFTGFITNLKTFSPFR